MRNILWAECPRKLTAGQIVALILVLLMSRPVGVAQTVPLAATPETRHSAQRPNSNRTVTPVPEPGAAPLKIENDPRTAASKRDVVSKGATELPTSMSASVQEKPLLPALLASPGVVGLSGTVRTVDGEPLAGVSLTADCDDTTASADSDDTGRFLITPLQSGHCQLDIDGTRAGARAHYGRFFAGVDLGVGTTVLPYVIWMTPIEERQVVEIPSPTTEQVTI